MNVQELLNLRTQFEETTEDFKLEQRGSDINTLKWFVENGHKSNSLRDGYQMAFEIAETIITEYENGRQEDNRGFG
mgnify:FL=1